MKGDLTQAPCSRPHPALIRARLCDSSSAALRRTIREVTWQVSARMPFAWTTASPQGQRHNASRNGQDESGRPTQTCKESAEVARNEESGKEANHQPDQNDGRDEITGCSIEFPVSSSASSSASKAGGSLSASARNSGGIGME